VAAVAVATMALPSTSSAWAAGSGHRQAPVTEKDFDSRHFDESTAITNRFLPLVPGTQFTLDGTAVRGTKGTHRVIFTVTDVTKWVDHVRTLVIWDQDIQDGVLAEEELSFFAQDDSGNVWLLGENPDVQDNGNVTAAATWLGGHSEAIPGVAMRVAPKVHTSSFTTVSLVGGVNVYQALGGWLNREVKLVPAREMTSGAPQGKVREQNIQAMVDSKFTATKVALDRLGYRVSVTGDGALVAMVKPGDPADGKLRTGDVITSVDGETVTRHDEVVSKVRQHHPGDVLRIGFRRNGADQATTLKAADAGNGQAIIGVELQTDNLKYNFPFEVSIDTGLIGGPSAGLAFALALIDDLAGGELTGGRDVAVTGTIDDAGNVGEVGGAAQKAITAKRAGAVAFLAPPAEEKEAREFAGKMRIIPVRSLNDALNALHQLGGTEVAQPDTPPTSTSPHS
jgi:PDZ domain-containing protein